MALRLRGCRNLPAYIPERLVDHLSALKVQLDKWLLVTVLAHFELSTNQLFKTTGTD